jgi:hypothetical protein
MSDIDSNYETCSLCGDQYSNSHNLDDSIFMDLYHSCPDCSQAANESLNRIDGEFLETPHNHNQSDTLEAWVQSKYLLLCRLAHLVVAKEASSARTTVLVIQVVPHPFSGNQFHIVRFYLSQLDSLETCCVDRSIYESLKQSSFTSIGPYRVSQSVKVFIHNGYSCTSVSCLRSAVGKEEERDWSAERLEAEIFKICHLFR